MHTQTSFALYTVSVVSLTKQTFNGATTSKINTTLDKNYIEDRVEEGFGAYISADEKVDDSTAAFPEHTWYIKKLSHHDYPWSVEFMMCDILGYDGYATVNDLPKYPQFMHYAEIRELIFNFTEPVLVGVLSPLTEENKDISKDTTDTTSIFAVLIKFLTSFFNFITSLFKR